ncbi:type II toxin-antitoxin system VapC family toxin [Mycobacterium branderi]|uniref:Ribonuclease VapC n=1 Tax=Mycobacterium branderi TaxID=43348 RepID=A0A7I7W6L5_9MYCO|nr:type II toxin-antitoxin system VapC family toxin [Mycobacterium branderi]MCV7234392.1 type II toxin-antitoxin system VapC family toxin [Mycobacterium branderi]ORA38446.1 VapC toxin family PIN domain ribonuclease [Mycobacterium branderi]BBZ13236.1 VapC ribonuclease [Mycobacterium branderi]
MILVDANIPMYLVGASRPHKLDAQRLLRSALSAGERLVTDAEVLQEICHRYAAINRREAIQPAFDAILGVVDDVLPIGQTHIEHARDTLLRYRHLSARDAVHIAVMAHHNIAQIMSFDRGFDAYPGITRLA